MAFANVHWLAGAMLLVAFALHVWLAKALGDLGALQQYNVFFDADTNQYLSAFGDGWSFNRQIHPGIALFFNLPLRAVDALGAMTGIWAQGVARQALALLVVPTCALIGGVYFWLTCVRILEGSSVQARRAVVVSSVL